MRFLAHLIVLLVLNIVTLWVAALYIPGFHLMGDVREYVAIGFVFMLLNTVVKPILKFILSPLIVLTLGLGLLAINAFLLRLLDIFFKNLTIDNVSALLYATILIGVLNFIFHLGTHSRT